MSKIDEVRKRVQKLDAEAARLEEDFERAQAERTALEVRRHEVDRALADGTANADAAFDALDRDDRKLVARVRGIALRRVEVRGALNDAREVQRTEQAAANEVEATALRARIADAERAIAPLRERLAALRSGFVTAQTTAPKERQGDADALDMLTFAAVAAGVEVVSNGAR